MHEDRPEDVLYVKNRFDENSKTYDFSEKTLEGRLHRQLEWEGIIQPVLPRDKSTRILDAGGGTGRITVPLAELGYPVTLCDLSTGMLAVARHKVQDKGLGDKVEIREADISSMPFADESFGLVICLHGVFCNADPFKATKDLTRVLKRKGVLIVDTLSRYWAATNVLKKDAEMSLQLLKSERNHAYDVHGDWQSVFSPEEFQRLFEKNGIENIKIYGSFYQITDLLAAEMPGTQDFNDRFIAQLGQVMSILGKEQSAVGMARELILVGEKA
jgi:ubiquinone/menaquinone biosynthesis C-methylase UbiE